MEKTEQRILIVESGSMLDEGIKSLLAGEPELDVSTINFAESDALLKDAVANHDIIVLTEADSLNRTRTSQLLQESSPQQTLRLIVIRPDDNILEVYDKQCLKATQKNDLISLIRHH